MNARPVPGSLVGALSLACCCAALAAPAARAAESGWVDLFNGKDLSGWVQRGGAASYQVQGNEIIGSSVPKTGNSFLCTARAYTNFVLELEFNVATNLNSGVQIRSECHPTPVEVKAGGKTIKIPANRVHGYQVEIDPSARAWTAGIYDEGRRGWLKDLKTNEPARKAFRQGGWNRLKIEARGSSIRTWLNEVAAAELEDDLTPAGFIGLQVHGVGDKPDPLTIRWRNVRIQELP